MSIRADQNLDPETAESAALWVARLHSDQATSADEAAFADWVGARADRREAYASALQTWNAIARMGADPMARAAIDRLRPKPAGVRSRRAMLGAGLAGVAACAGAGLLLGAGGESYVTAIGEQRRATLSDGSVISLNTDTRVRVRFDETERRLWLDRGQAHFKVSPDSTRPFRVFVGDEEVRALGTAFEVRRESGRMRVILEEGVVGVYRGASETVLSERDPALVLAPGQAADIGPQQAAHVLEVDLRSASAWRYGQMIFDAEPLEGAVAEINRYHRRKIVLAEPGLGDIAISGVFQTGRPEAFADVLTSAFPIVIQSQDDAEIRLVAAPIEPPVARLTQN